ncbi:integral membrane protein [Cordyceps javanica]|uniref:Integral membrane protein n=1 Tax=Cordyceps javanica TaxID=43265 RepID=A0A545V9Y0_9HYPO|nr:integral membrane protein [Cordyceps javanica]TQW09752.1 integral membrane protein [Cordyceps javanica]
MTVFESQTASSHADYVRIPCIVFFAVTPIFLGIRVYNRISRRTGLGWDDATIILSYFCTLTVMIFMMVSVDAGFGKHVKSLSKPNKLKALQMFYIAQIFYKLTINLTKTSILLLYRRIFVQKWFRYSCNTLICIVMAYCVANYGINWYANAGFAIATDLLILSLPMQPIWASKLPVNQKRALMLVFALGGFVTVTSILRATTLNFSITSPDVTYDIASTLWTMIEMNVALICACLPMCRMVLAWMLPGLFGSMTIASTPKNPHSSGSSNPTMTIGHRRLRSLNGQWAPYTGPSKAEGRSSVHHHEESSEEFILAPYQRVYVQEDLNGIIRKTTQYEVYYEGDLSKAEKGRSIATHAYAP